MSEQIIDIIKKDNLPALKLYAQRKSSWRSITFYDEGFNLLHLAVCYNKTKLLRWLLLNGFDVNGRTKAGDTALHLAVEATALDCLKELINNKADMELRDDGEEVTAFLKAVQLKQVSAVKLLASSGANVDCKDKEGNSALQIAIDLQEEEIIDFLIENKADVKTENVDGYTPLHTACKRSDIVFNSLMS
eukprot:TRINITY_DN10269_c0_g5_i8.p3 TRINITY_DN10269_c0_g5~~TRINITY_DN10269_c0_g5_i8.p3  ORF type:complete len:190 (+),score=45.63 TRINITY_DN10269_c0_g5_i8:170-739(+)